MVLVGARDVRPSLRLPPVYMERVENVGFTPLDRGADITRCDVTLSHSVASLDAVARRLPPNVFVIWFSDAGRRLAAIRRSSDAIVTSVRAPNLTTSRCGSSSYNRDRLRPPRYRHASGILASAGRN